MLLNEPTQDEIEEALASMGLSDNVRAMVHEVLIDGLAGQVVAKRYDVSPSAVTQNVNRVLNAIRKNKMPTAGEGEVLICLPVPKEKVELVQETLTKILK